MEAADEDAVTMGDVVTLSDRRREAAIRMSGSGAPFRTVSDRYGFDAAAYARAVLWQRNGKDMADEGGCACWLNVFGTGDEPPPRRPGVAGERR